MIVTGDKCHFIHHKYHVHWPEIEPRPPEWINPCALALAFNFHLMAQGVIATFKAYYLLLVTRYLI